MLKFYTRIKIIFYILSAVVGVFFLRGSFVIESESYVAIKNILIPGYLVFCGMMMSYLMIKIMLVKHYKDKDFTEHTYMRGLSIGLGCGLVMALLYVFV